MSRRALIRAVAVAAGLAAVLAIGGTAAAQQAAVAGYTVQPLVSDQMGAAPTTDPNLVNPWGIVAGPTTPWWVANNETDTSTLYNGAGQRFPLPPASPLVVSVAGSPTGIVFNGGTQFLVPSASGMSPARFIFATQSGTILGWNGGPAAQLAADRSSVDASYFGLAIAGDRLYAADFHNRRVDVFDGSFNVVTAPGAFVDPKLPSGYAPFGIQNIGGHIFVAYAKQDAEGEDEVVGRGLGTVDEYDANGVLLARVANHGKLNAPWGIAMAPASGFGPLSGTLIVGNFGDGRLNAYRKDASGRWGHVDQLRGTNGLAVEIEGLWGIGFGNGGNAGPTTSLFFAAGIEDEEHGLFGAITAN
jgi:uncharacterized protein (TIGR03118 family)